MLPIKRAKAQAETKDKVRCVNETFRKTHAMRQTSEQRDWKGSDADASGERDIHHLLQRI